MSHLPSSPAAIRSPGSLPRRTFLRGLAAASLTYGLARNYAAEAPTPALPPTGPRGRTTQIDSEIKEYRDKDTGARVRQLTGDGSDNVHLYFTSESFVEGSNRIVFGSNRTGKFQHYMLEIREKKLTQLTDGQDIGPTMACLGGGGHLIYFDGPVLHSLKLDTLVDRELYRVPDGWEPHLPTCTASGEYVAFCYKEKRAVSTLTNVIYSAMDETYYQHPPCVIMRLHTGNGKAAAVWGEPNWISHVLIHPTQPDTILFCHEGGGAVKQRMFILDVSAKLARTAQPLCPMRPGEFTVHEYFTRGGEVGYQYEVERGGKMEYYNALVRTDGTWVRQYQLPGPRPGHIQSNTDNTLIVGDRGFLSPTDKDGSFYMSLMTHANGYAHLRRLCRYQPGPTQFSHGHPVFSRDDQWVLYNSRLGAKENIAMADVTSLA
jgi:oligogalacturonide lyase